MSAEPDSAQQPVWHVIVLGSLTFGAYLAYWFYKSLRDLKKAALLAAETPGKESDQTEDYRALMVFKGISPIWRTIAALVPILQIYIALTTILSIAALHPDPNSFSRRRPLVAAGLLLTMMIAFMSLCRLPGMFSFLCLFMSIPAGIVQHWINAFWSKQEEDKLPVRHAFSLVEMGVIILGAMVLGLNVAGYMIGVKLH